MSEHQDNDNGDKPDKPSAVQRILSQLESIAGRQQASLPQVLTTVNQALMNNRMQTNMDRMEAQVDAEILKCNPNYKPPPKPEDDDVAINTGVFIDSDIMKTLIDSAWTEQRFSKFAVLGTKKFIFF